MTLTGKFRTMVFQLRIILSPRPFLLNICSLSNFLQLIYFWLCCVFAALPGLSPVAASGATLPCDLQASHWRFSCCGAWALNVWAKSLCCSGLAPLRHVGSSRTRNRTCVPCIGRWLPSHCSTREVLAPCFKIQALLLSRYGEATRGPPPLKT